MTGCKITVNWIKYHMITSGLTAEQRMGNTVKILYHRSCFMSQDYDKSKLSENSLRFIVTRQKLHHKRSNLKLKAK